MRKVCLLMLLFMLFGCFACTPAYVMQGNTLSCRDGVYYDVNVNEKFKYLGQLSGENDVQRADKNSLYALNSGGINSKIVSHVYVRVDEDDIVVEGVVIESQKLDRHFQWVENGDCSKRGYKYDENGFCQSVEYIPVPKEFSELARTKDYYTMFDYLSVLKFKRIGSRTNLSIIYFSEMDEKLSSLKEGADYDHLVNLEMIRRANDAFQFEAR